MQQQRFVYRMARNRRIRFAVALLIVIGGAWLASMAGRRPVYVEATGNATATLDSRITPDVLSTAAGDSPLWGDDSIWGTPPATSPWPTNDWTVPTPDVPTLP
jgi:hypothetical protein